MKRAVMILSSALVLSSVTLATLALAKENPYQPIIDRNAFGLKPPPPPPTNVIAETPPMTVKLAGLISLGGDPKAFFEMTEPGPGKQPKRPQGMSKGQELDGVKVLDIDVEKGEVRVKNGTMEMTLNFEKDGIKSAPGAAPPPRTAVVPPMTLPPVRPVITTPGAALPVPGANTAGAVTVTGGSGTPAVGSVMVSGGPGSAFVSGGISTPAIPALTTIPTRALRVPIQDGQGAVPPGQNIVKPQVSYEQSILSVAVATELTRGLVERGEHPPFPPTELTPDPPKLPGAIVQPQIETDVLPAPNVTVPGRRR